MPGGARELVVLGTSAQVPTRRRNQNGYLLRWDDDAILFDPGEGTQRQLLAAEASSGRLSAICITHFHGDHCLGLPGVLARFVLDHRDDPVDLYFPASGLPYVERLRRAAVFDEWPHLRLVPVPPEGDTYERRGYQLVGRPLRHSVDTIGWRIEEPDRRHLLEDELEAHGIVGSDVGRLVRDGQITTSSGTVTYDQVSEPRLGQRFAFVMDTAPCDEALELAAGADLLVAESTFLHADAPLARETLHLTAREAGQLAARAGARRLVVSHFSARYPDNDDFGVEAGKEHGDVVAAHDLARVEVPPMR
jgi:ribonuclease Z